MKALEGRAPCSPHPPPAHTHSSSVRLSGSRLTTAGRVAGRRGYLPVKCEHLTGIFIVSARPLPPAAPAAAVLPAMAAPGRCHPCRLLPAFPPALWATRAPVPPSALGAHPVLPIPQGMADSFCFLTAFKVRLQFSPLPCCSPWGGIPGCAESGGSRATRSPPCPTPRFGGGCLRLRGFGVPQDRLFPRGARSPPLALGRAKLRARDPHVDAGGCVVPLARRFCGGGCAAGGAPARRHPEPQWG